MCVTPNSETVSDVGESLYGHFEQQANTIAEDRDADVILFNGLITRQNAYRLIQDCENRSKRQNLFLLMTTPGGDPDAAYIIARFFQSNYDHFFLFVAGPCKSAGTLVALGAHELIISNYGELGPLDVQLSKKDELGETQSGLVGLDALAQLQRIAFDSFEEFFLNVKFRTGLTSKTCAKIAIDLANGLLTPVYGQIDPIHLGETGRSMKIAVEYAERLIEGGRNIESENVVRLAEKYPSHGFVIDRAEAKELFRTVSEPTGPEQS